MKNEGEQMIRIRHTGVYVQDMDVQKAFYEQTLGMSVKVHQVEKGAYINTLLGTDTESEVETCKLAADDGSMIELCKINPGVGKDNNSVSLFAAGNMHIAITVKNVASEYERLRSMGLSVVSEPQLSPDGGAKVFFCQDPEGNYLELVEEVTR